MTEAPEIKQNTVSATARRREAKRRAWDRFFTKGNSLTLIAATLVPLIMYMAAQGIYSMLYFSFEPQNMEEWIVNLMSVINIILVFLMLPLFGGTLYISTGLARGEERHIRDIFYAYTSWRAHIRTWTALLIPLLALAAVAGIVVMLAEASVLLSKLAMTMENMDVEFYPTAIAVSGEVITLIFAIGGLLLSMYILPFLWLVFSHPEQPLGVMFTRSASLAHGRLGAWLTLHLSFLGWLLLSVATVGILLVLFTVPYYLLAVTLYIEQEEDRTLISDEIYG